MIAKKDISPRWKLRKRKGFGHLGLKCGLTDQSPWLPRERIEFLVQRRCIRRGCIRSSFVPHTELD